MQKHRIQPLLRIRTRIPLRRLQHELPPNNRRISIQLRRVPLGILLGESAHIARLQTRRDQACRPQGGVDGVFQRDGCGEVAARGASHDEGAVGGWGAAEFGGVGVQPFVGGGAVVQGGRVGVFGREAVVGRGEDDVAVLADVAAEEVFVVEGAGEPAAGVGVEAYGEGFWFWG